MAGSGKLEAGSKPHTGVGSGFASSFKLLAFSFLLMRIDL